MQQHSVIYEVSDKDKWDSQFSIQHVKNNLFSAWAISFQFLAQIVLTLKFFALGMWVGENKTILKI